jgi:hypothetical protein
MNRKAILLVVGAMLSSGLSVLTDNNRLRRASSKLSPNLSDHSADPDPAVMTFSS